jgi:Ca2+/Na+ antiporter
MLNKKIIFLLFSIFLGLIISFFYNKEFNETFLLMSMLIAVIFYIIFYYLADIKNKENFTDYYNSKFFNKKINNTKNNNIRDYLEDTIEEEHSLIKKYINNNKINIIEEESHNVIEEESYRVIEEETHPYINHHIIEEETNNNQNIVQEEESSTYNYVNPDLNKILLNNPIPNGTAFSPLNINISYNSQNSNNELDNNKTVNGNKENSCMKNQNQNQNQNQNLGDYNDTTRIHNNSDWIYGNNAWTNNPDYYIPRKVPQPLNQLMNTKKNKENTVCPLMVNTPWTEYKSGDSEPDPYNL